MLADAKYIQAHLIGQLDGLDQVAQTLGRANGVSRWHRWHIRSVLDKGIHANFECRRWGIGVECMNLSRNRMLLEH